MIALFRPAAAADVEAAFKWYEDQRVGLGQELLEEIRAMMHRILENPRQFAVLHRQTHRALLHRFPLRTLLPNPQPGSHRSRVHACESKPSALDWSWLTHSVKPVHCPLFRVLILFFGGEVKSRFQLGFARSTAPSGSSSRRSSGIGSARGDEHGNREIRGPIRCPATSRPNCVNQVACSPPTVRECESPEPTLDYGSTTTSIPFVTLARTAADDPGSKMIPCR